MDLSVFQSIVFSFLLTFDVHLFKTFKKERFVLITTKTKEKRTTHLTLNKYIYPWRSTTHLKRDLEMNKIIVCFFLEHYTIQFSQLIFFFCSLVKFVCVCFACLKCGLVTIWIGKQLKNSLQLKVYSEVGFNSTFLNVFSPVNRLIFQLGWTFHIKLK